MSKTDTTRLFAAYPHLAKIEQTWGTRECRQFISRVLNDSRDGGRQGFPPEHARTLMALFMEHDREFPAFEERLGTTWWEQEGARRGTRD
ncbi:hypothetical protein [Pseudothauera rhizosphaerae]|uniref:Uncharacterized protein n=1 Tax=Pseudothauera rhizosphaerae TaxID=2565932 RepID=A0A4V3WB27_9RHOO|nr:hypothetical protein [Pseudothauera rhizosphaerae]THF61650.1 hypothetical protein E6O51_09365 [Pseudothauera rhizosphaerae]